MPLKVSHGIKSWIDDFQQSKDKRFDGKSAEKRREMAIAAYMAAKREQKENVKSADRKPQIFTQPDGKKGVRMVPVDREVLKQEKNLEWLKAALEAQARKAKPCDEDVEETAEATIKELDKKTLGSYIKKAGPDREKQKAQAARHDAAGMDADKDADMYKHYAKSQRAMDKAANRSKYIGKAVDKLTKEEAKVDELSMSLKDIQKTGLNKAASGNKEKLKKDLEAMKAKLNKEAKVDEVLDRPGALDSYRKKADASGNRARNSATRKILTQPKNGKRPDHSDELNTMRKRNKGQDMADRAANRHFRKSLGLGYNSKKESVELDENKYAAKAAERHKNLMKQARSDMKRATSHSDMIKHMNKYQAANKAYDRATRGQFDEKKVDEISNAKMGQYVRKAADDAARKASKGDVVGARQRVKGVNKAMDKMDKNRLYGRQ